MWLFVLAACVLSSDAFELSIFKSPLEVLQHENALLGCKITGYRNESEIDPSNVTVRWFFGPEGNRKEVFSFHGDSYITARPGAMMSEGALRRGDASMHLPNVKLDEAGEYTCVVLLDSRKEERSLRMHVWARPSIHLSPLHISVVSGKEASVQCNVSGFYLSGIDISWVEVSQGKSRSLVEGVCRTALVNSSDGTFTTYSLLKVTPTLGDDGNKYRCIVRYKALHHDFTLEASLRVEEPHLTPLVTAILGIIFGVLLFCMICLSFGFCIHLKSSGNDVCLKAKMIIAHPYAHLEESNPDYSSSKYRPNQSSVVRVLKTGCRPLRHILHCCSEDSTPRRSVPAASDEVMIPLRSKLEYSCSVDVSHCKVAPKIPEIIVPPQVFHQEQTTLTCLVNEFKPRPLGITWYQVGRDGARLEIAQVDHQSRVVVADNPKAQSTKYAHNISEFMHADNSYIVTSVLMLTPAVQEDDGTAYICKVEHVATGLVMERAIVLGVKATPKLDAIWKASGLAITKEELVLNCRIHSFSPKAIGVVWCKDGEELPESVELSDPICGKDGLYCCLSTLRLMPIKNAFASKYTCRVYHESLAQPKEMEWILD